jgi:DNA transformation protein
VKRDDSFKEFVLDQLSGLDGLRAKAMFGGWGLYHGEKFFGIVYKDRLYFKTTPATVGKYKKAGMKPFKPNAKMTLKNYYEVPVDVLEDREELKRWV